jgi:pimeloyl-ACP methyl ester carboxylesterase
MQKYRWATIFLLLFNSPAIWAASPLDGDWLGSFERPGSLVCVHTRFVTTTNGTNGTMDVFDQGDKAMALADWPLDKLQLTPSRVHFEMADKPGPQTIVMGPSPSPLSFEGRMTNGVITGVVEDSGKKLPFRLDLAAKVEPARYVGNYQVAPGHFISVTPSYPPKWLLATDLQSGQGAVLFPRSEADFICGSGLKLYPVQAGIHFTTNQLGQATALEWKPKNGPALVGARIKALAEENVSFTNGDVTLSGTIVLPPTKGPYPAVVIVLGSSGWVRNEAESIAQFFVLNGVAALIYDKRGCGNSTGDYNNCSYDDFAGDALAGAELLKNRPDINPHQIGLWGGSEGGWIVSLAASRSADVAFIINMSGPGISPEETSAYQVEHWMKAEGYSKADAAEARSLYLLNSRYFRTGSDGSEVEAARKADQNKPWYNELSRNYFSFTKKTKLVAGYDPVVALHQVHCPVLAMFGEADPLVPARQSAAIWKTALRQAGNHDVVIKIFPHAGHTMADPRTGAPVPGFVALQRNWLLKHVTVRRSSDISLRCSALGVRCLPGRSFRAKTGSAFDLPSVALSLAKEDVQFFQPSPPLSLCVL